MKKLATCMAVIAAIALFGVDDASGQEFWEDYRLRVKVSGGPELFYSHDELKALAPGREASSRGEKRQRRIPLTMLMTHETGLTMDDVTRVILVGDTRSMLLEGDQLQYLDQLQVKLGNLRPAVAAADDQIPDGLQPTFGKPRFKNIESIYIYQVLDASRGGPGADDMDERR